MVTDPDGRLRECTGKPGLIGLVAAASSPRFRQEPPYAGRFPQDAARTSRPRRSKTRRYASREMKAFCGHGDSVAQAGEIGGADGRGEKDACVSFAETGKGAVEQR